MFEQHRKAVRIGGVGAFAVVTVLGSRAGANTGTQLPLTQYEAGTESQTNVTNGDFESVTGSDADVWNENFSDMQAAAPINPPTPASASGSFAAQGVKLETGDTNRDSYSLENLTFDQNESYVLSGYLWNFGQNYSVFDADWALLELTGYNDPPGPPGPPKVNVLLEVLGIEGGDADLGYYLYNTFDGSTFPEGARLEAMLDASDTAGAARPTQVLAQFDNVAITPLSQFEGPVANITWNTSSGTWATGANWRGGTAPGGVNAHAHFGSLVNTPHTVTVAAPVTVGTITFDSTNAYLIESSGAGSITIDTNGSDPTNIPPGVINVWNGQHTISAPLTLNETTIFMLSKAANKLTLSNLTATGRNVGKDGLGTLAVQHIRANTLTIARGAIEITANGGDTGNSRLNSLIVSPGAKLDLNDNDLVVDGANYSALETLVKQGFNGGNWLGNGITSSSAANDSNFVTALGIINNADTGYSTFGAFTDLNGDEVLIKYTYYGDADLGGTVNLDDFNQFLFGFNPANAAPQIWLNGDFNYTGSVNLDDFNLFLFGLSNQGGTLVSPELFAALSQFVTNEGVDVDLSTVPEPGAAALLALGSAVLLRRRRI